MNLRLVPASLALTSAMWASYTNPYDLSSQVTTPISLPALSAARSSETRLTLTGLSSGPGCGFDDCSAEEGSGGPGGTGGDSVVSPGGGGRFGGRASTVRRESRGIGAGGAGSGRYGVGNQVGGLDSPLQEEGWSELGFRQLRAEIEPGFTDSLLGSLETADSRHLFFGGVRGGASDDIVDRAGSINATTFSSRVEGRAKRESAENASEGQDKQGNAEGERRKRGSYTGTDIAPSDALSPVPEPVYLPLAGLALGAIVWADRRLRRYY